MLKQTAHTVDSALIGYVRVKAGGKHSKPSALTADVRVDFLFILRGISNPRRLRYATAWLSTAVKMQARHLNLLSLEDLEETISSSFTVSS